MAEVVDLRDRLLPAVATLREVHRRPQPVELVREGRRVDLCRGARTPRRDPQRLESEGPRDGTIASAAATSATGTSVSRYVHAAPGCSPVAYWCPPAEDGPRVDPGGARERSPRVRRSRSRRSDPPPRRGSRNRIRSRKVASPGPPPSSTSNHAVSPSSTTRMAYSTRPLGSRRSASADSPGARRARLCESSESSQVNTVGARDGHDASVGEVDDGVPAASRRCSPSGEP